VLQALCTWMCSGRDPITRRTCAFQLTRLKWLDDLRPAAADLLEYAELIGSYVAAPTTRSYLAEGITRLIDATGAALDQRLHARLLAIRAMLRWELKQADEALSDYMRANDIVNALIGTDQEEHDDYLIRARVNLGLGNINQMRAESTLEEEWEHRHELLEKAAKSFQMAVVAAKHYRDDPLFTAGALCELSNNAAFRQSWDEAEPLYEEAIQILEAQEMYIDTQAYIHHYIQTLEAISLIHWEKGQSAAANDHAAALAAYKDAYDWAMRELEFLEAKSAQSREHEAIFWAHMNAGDYLIAMCSLAARASLPIPLRTADPSLEACQHWSTALDMAQRIGDSEKVEMVRERRAEYCQ